MKKIGSFLFVLLIMLFAASPIMATETTDTTNCPTCDQTPPTTCTGPDCISIDTGGWINGFADQIEKAELIAPKTLFGDMRQCFATFGAAGPGFSGTYLVQQVQTIDKTVEITNGTEFFTGLQDGKFGGSVSYPECTALNFGAHQALNGKSEVDSADGQWAMSGSTQAFANACAKGKGLDIFTDLNQQGAGGYDHWLGNPDENYARQMAVYQIESHLTIGTQPTPAP